MEQKEQYHTALLQCKGKLDEIELGAMLGIDECATQRIISQLLSEHRIVFQIQGACNYTCIKKK